MESLETTKKYHGKDCQKGAEIRTPDTKVKK
jgi:hypothetical protein